MDKHQGLHPDIVGEGQDSLHLAEFLLEHGYAVFGMVRRASKDNVEHRKLFRHSSALSSSTRSSPEAARPPSHILRLLALRARDGHPPQLAPLPFREDDL